MDVAPHRDARDVIVRALRKRPPIQNPESGVIHQLYDLWLGKPYDEDGEDEGAFLKYHHGTGTRTGMGDPDGVLTSSDLDDTALFDLSDGFRDRYSVSSTLSCRNKRHTTCCGSVSSVMILLRQRQ